MTVPDPPRVSEAHKRLAERLREAIRKADAHFGLSFGAGHDRWMEQFLPALEAEGLALVDAALVESQAQQLADAQQIEADALSQAAMNSAPSAMVTSAGWQCPVCDSRGHVHQANCFVKELADEAQRLRSANKRLSRTNGRLREEAADLAAARQERDELAKAREALRERMIKAIANETEGRDTYADGFANGLLAAVQDLDRALAVLSAGKEV